MGELSLLRGLSDCINVEAVASLGNSARPAQRRGGLFMRRKYQVIDRGLGSYLCL